MKKDRFIRLVAEIIEGTQVPRSLGPILGKATKPWDNLRDELNCFGYMNANDIEQRIKEKLKD